MLILPVLAFLGPANLAYALLNLRLLQGLRKLEDAHLLKTPSSPRAPSSSKAPLPTVTILIAARNEEKRISPCLNALMAQNYPRDRLQIILVNDRSEDGTAVLLDEYRAKEPGLFTIVSVTELPLGLSPKKHALSRGMQAAKSELIMTTDADCIMGPEWIRSMAEEFAADTGLVLGMTSYYPLGYPENPLPSLAWKIQALEFISYGIVAAALVGLRFPVHGNANNMAYRRKIFDETAGFGSHGRIVSGDDDFLIQSIHALGEWRIRYSIRPESQVRTEPPLSWRQFWEQRKRWASKCGFYKPKQAIFLSAIFLYYALIMICLGVGLLHRSLFPLFLFGLGSWCLKTGMDYWVMRQGTGLFAKRELMSAFPATSALHIPLILAAVLAGSFGQFTWKGQTHRSRS